MVVFPQTKHCGLVYGEIALGFAILHCFYVFRLFLGTQT